MNKFELLLYCIENANHALEHYRKHKNNQDTYSIVSASLFRKIIEQCTGVAACAENGLIGPSATNYRGAFEAYLSFQYVTGNKNTEEHTKVNRAKAYMINYHQQQIDTYNNNLKDKEDLNLERDKLLKEEVEKSEKELNKPEYTNVLNEYEKVKKMINKNKKKGQKEYLPKWFSLYGGPSSFNGLARKMNFSGDKNSKKTSEEMSTLYGSLSVESHNFLALRDFTLNKNGEKIISPIHSIKTTKNENVHLLMARTLLTSSITKFTKEIHPEYEIEWRKFMKTIVRYLSV